MDYRKRTEQGKLVEIKEAPSCSIFIPKLDNEDVNPEQELRSAPKRKRRGRRMGTRRMNQQAGKRRHTKKSYHRSTQRRGRKSRGK